MQEISELIPVNFEKVMQSRSYTCVVLEAEEKKFAIYTDLSIGKTMQLYLSSIEKQRPNTYDLINQVFYGLEIKVKQVVINDLKDTTYFARLFLEHKAGEILSIIEIDARPSDCIMFALLNKTPIYCTREVFERTIYYEE
ncbi:MAG: DUF151 domain-containing protein [Chlamydiales bacterium]